MNEATGVNRLAQVQVGDALPERELVCDNVQSMLYNAALWNGHRIHFDEPYAKEVEGYPGLVVPGPSIVSEMDSTTVVLPGYEARVDSVGNLLINPVA